ncbi:hypothetical protein DIPPA_01793 [Diplonema papillatum]|nr:hypothetical protein DIPPA_01793 [Diplonema papillatum]
MEEGQVTWMELGWDWRLVYVAVERGERGGVGFVVAPGVRVLKVVKESARVLWMDVQVQGVGGKTRLVSCYAPHAFKAEQEHAAFYADLEEPTRVREVAQVVILGDMNATLQVGEGGARYALDETERTAERAAASGRLIAYNDEHDVVSVATQHRDAPAPTFDGNGRHEKRMIDHVLVRARWKSSYSATKVCASPVDSDHRVLLCRFRSVFAVDSAPKPPPPDYSALADDTSPVHASFVMELSQLSDYGSFCEVAGRLCRQLPRRRPFKLDPEWLALGGLEQASMREKEARVAIVLQRAVQEVTHLF